MLELRPSKQFKYLIFCLIIVIFLGGCLSPSSKNVKGTSNNPAGIGETVEVRDGKKIFKVAALDVDRTGKSPLDREDFEYVGVKIYVNYVDGDTHEMIDSFDFKAHPAPGGKWHDVIQSPAFLITVYGGKKQPLRFDMLPGDKVAGLDSIYRPKE